MKLRNLFYMLALLVSSTLAFNVNLSGKLDLTEASSKNERVESIEARIIGTNIVDTVNNDGTYLLTSSGVVSVEHKVNVVKPVLAWKELGKTVKMTNGNSNNYVVDAYSFDGKQVVSGAKFINGVATVGTGSQMLYTRLRNIGSTVASRSMVDSPSDTSVVGTVIFIVTTCDTISCRTDTLTEIPVTKWDTVLSTKYVVQRNVKVTVPTKYAAADSVKVGWYNIYVNPQNYFTIKLRNYKSNRWSGYIYSTYDSAAYSNDEYLYSAVAILKRADNVIAFSDSSARVTAGTGDFDFVESDFVNKIISRPLADTAIIPWYAIAVNKSSVNVDLHKVLRLDSTINYTDSLYVPSESKYGKQAHIGSYENRLSIVFQIDTTMDRQTYSMENGDVKVSEIDSLRIEYTPDTTVVDTVTGIHSVECKFVDSTTSGVKRSVSVKFDISKILASILDNNEINYQNAGHGVQLTLPGATKQSVADSAKIFFVKKHKTSYYK